jgi:hypothetical protein
MCGHVGPEKALYESVENATFYGFIMFSVQNKTVRPIRPEIPAIGRNYHI